MRSNVQFDENRQVELVAFAHPPTDARSACIAVVDATKDPSLDISAYRALGTPVVFVCYSHELQWWKLGADQPEQVGQSIPTAKVTEFFRNNRKDLAPDAVYRAKTWARFYPQYQLSFVDLGLMPLVEEEVGRALANLIERQVSFLKSALGWQRLDKDQGRWLLQTVFWLVSAKIFRDKQVPTFRDLELTDVEDVFQRVAKHYNANNLRISTRRQRDVLRECARSIERFSNLGLATTESLAYVYENALISKATRQELGTHSTPSYLVDYVIGKLAPWIEEIPLAERNVFEPACGHAAFLVSAMRLLTELLPDEKATPSERRRYLRSRVHGCDVDAFALDLARLSLTQADIPNPGDWDLQPVDMFLGDILEQQAKNATILLANPPFHKFSVEERDRYRRRAADIHYLNKTAELLSRTLPHLPLGAVFGVVIPQGLLHDTNSTPFRRLLLEQFELSEICLFPDNVFTFSDAESAVIIGRRPSDRGVVSKPFLIRRVRERDVARFKRAYEVTAEQPVHQSRLLSHDNFELRVPELEEIWEWCRQQGQQLSDTAEIGQGFIFQGKDLPPNARTYSQRYSENMVKGFVHFGRNLRIHELPKEYWLNLAQEVIRRPVTGTTIDIPQVLLNYARVSRGPWRLKALIDREGHAVTSRFITVRPKLADYPLEFFWALLNSPLANAYAYTHFSKRDILVGGLRQMPVPSVSSDDMVRVANAAKAYLDAVSTTLGELKPIIDPQSACQLLICVDAEVLSLYNLPSSLERQLLDLFTGHSREGVPFPFDRYYPEHFEADISLANFVRITEGWSQTNERRGELIRKKHSGAISQEELQELERLQMLATNRRRLVAPFPFRELEQLRDQLAAMER